MPVFTVGLNSMLTPFSFGNANPKLIFHWSVNKRDVLDLLPRHMEVSIQLPSKNNVTMVVYMKAAGRISIKVFDKLLLFSPVFSTEEILISTNSRLKLYTKMVGKERKIQNAETLHDVFLSC